ADFGEREPPLRRATRHVVSVGSHQVYQVLVQEPAAHLLRFLSELPRDTAGCRLNEAALLHPRPKDGRILLQMLISLRMRHNACDALTLKLVDQLAYGEDLLVRELH